MARPGNIEAFQMILKEASEKLGKLVAEANTLKTGLELAAAEAESDGCRPFATVFRLLASQASQFFDASDTADRPTNKRRGRVPKGSVATPVND